MESVFTPIAPVYDRLNDFLSGGLHRFWKTRLMERLCRLSPDARLVLDVATGTGEIADGFSKRLPGARVLGLDPCREMMEEGRRKGRRAIWIEAGSELIPLESASVDILTCAFGVRNFRERTRALREWERVLKAGALAAVIEIHPIPRVWYRGLLAWYWEWIMPALGASFGKGEAYRYLRDSSQAFLSQKALVEEIGGAGLELIETRSLFASGMVSCSLFRKP